MAVTAITTIAIVKICFFMVSTPQAEVTWSFDQNCNWTYVTATQLPSVSIDSLSLNSLDFTYTINRYEFPEDSTLSYALRI